GDIRSAPNDRVIPAWTFCCSPPTRTMKNSSRFDEKIARNLSRSISGTCGSCASSSTRRLNSSHDNSRLMYRLGSSRLDAGIGNTVGCMIILAKQRERTLYQGLHVAYIRETKLRRE